MTLVALFLVSLRDLCSGVFQWPLGLCVAVGSCWHHPFGRGFTVLVVPHQEVQKLLFGFSCRLLESEASLLPP